MRLSFWLNRLFSSFSVRPRKKKAGELRRRLPRDVGSILELLEDRALLAATVQTTSFLDSGTLATGVTQITVTFSEPVLGADQAANYELRQAAADGLLLASDTAVNPSNVNVNGNTATLTFSALTEDVYRLTVNDSITDASSNALDGDGDGTAGGDWRRDFVVGALSTSLTSPNGLVFDPEFGGFGAGQFVQGTGNAFDGLGRLDVDGFQYTTSTNGAGHYEDTSSLAGPLSSLYADISGLTTTITLTTESLVYVGADFGLVSTDNSNWVGSTRFVINGTAENASATFANPYILPTLNGTTSSVSVSVDPPNTATGGQSNDHTHFIDPPATSVSGGAGGVVDILGFFAGGTSTNHTHTVDIGAFATAPHSHTVSLSPTNSMRNLQVNAEDWLVLPAGTYVISVQAQATGSVQFDGQQALNVAHFAKTPDSNVQEDQSTLTAALSGGYADISGLTTTVTLTTESLVYVGADFGLVSTDNSNWVGSTRFVINGTAENASATFANPYILPTLNGTTSSVSVSVDPPNTATGGQSNDHTHFIDPPATSVSGGAGGVVDILGFFAGGTSTNHTHTVDIGAFATAPHSHTVSLSPTNSMRNLQVNAEDWLILPAGTYVISAQAQATGSVQFNGQQVLKSWLQPIFAPSIGNSGRMISTNTATTGDLTVSREATVPASGLHDFARTVDTFTNSTGSTITAPVRVVGNLGSDTNTVVFATSDGDTIVETTDWWFGTDDADGTGTPAVIHLLHGPAGLVPSNVAVTDDNVEWMYNLTVEAG